MKKKITTTIIATIIITIIFIATNWLLFGIGTNYIADYMPPTNVTNIEADFASVALKTTMIRLLLFIILNIMISIIYTQRAFKTKLYTTKKDILFTVVLFIIPLIVCFFLIYSQLDYTV